ncbi:MAG: hypothetical protein HQK78_19405 [Desulfobacterales bacterium]|nr:hypothetical protein [Desulfobacterales bacterium]
MKEEIVNIISKTFSYDLSFPALSEDNKLNAEIEAYYKIYQDKMREQITNSSAEIMQEIITAIHSRFDVPKNLLGWSIVNHNGIFRAHKRIDGKLKSIHLGKTYNKELFELKICNFFKKNM